MKVREIKVSYSKNGGKSVIVNCSEMVYKVAVSHWNLNIIEFQEEVKIILLDRANAVLGIYDLSKGGVSACVVDIKILLSVALKAHASSVALLHNHPSGILKPSVADKSLTTKVKKACETVDLVLIDHLIISKDSYYSFSDQGNL